MQPPSWTFVALALLTYLSQTSATPSRSPIIDENEHAHVTYGQHRAQRTPVRPPLRELTLPIDPSTPTRRNTQTPLNMHSMPFGVDLQRGPRPERGPRYGFQRAASPSERRRQTLMSSRRNTAESMDLSDDPPVLSANAFNVWPSTNEASPPSNTQLLGAPYPPSSLANGRLNQQSAPNNSMQTPISTAERLRTIVAAARPQDPRPIVHNSRTRAAHNVREEDDVFR